MKKFTILAAILFLVSQFGTASADSFDNFQAALVSGRYTIRYENITPPNQQSTMKERKTIVNGKMAADNDYLMYRKISGVITGDGVNQYIETSANPSEDFVYASCSLRRGNEIFIYTRLEQKNKVQYIGQSGKKGQVEATPYVQRLMTLYSFGDNEDLTRVLNAALPNSQKATGAVIYRKIKSGVLGNGLEYADLKAINPPAGVIFDAIRYYFQGGKLVKISAGQYYGTGADLDGRRIIIKVADFQDSADSKLLQLPKELKDVTKRENAKKA